MTQEDRTQWEEFLDIPSSDWDIRCNKTIAKLHAKYFKHPLYYPELWHTKLWDKWIKELDDEYRRSSGRDNEPVGWVATKVPRQWRSKGEDTKRS